MPNNQQPKNSIIHRGTTPLSEECEELGYFKIFNLINEYMERDRAKSITLQTNFFKYFLFNVLLRVNNPKLGNYTRKHAQQAYDAFHQ